VPAWIQHALETYGYIALFVIVCAEGFGVPVPGETALLAAGAFAGAGKLHIVAVIGVAALAAISGDFSGYWIGRKWGRQLILSLGPRIGLTPRRQAAIEAFFDRYGIAAVFIGRYQSVLRTYIALFAGIARMPFPIFAPVRALSCVIWAIAFGLLAYFLGAQWSRLQQIIQQVGTFSLVIFLLLLAIGVIAWYFWHRTSEQPPQE
jgi:membrane protein DedA with SNARE-associated domain